MVFHCKIIVLRWRYRCFHWKHARFNEHVFFSMRKSIASLQNHDVAMGNHDFFEKSKLFNEKWWFCDEKAMVFKIFKNIVASKIVGFTVERWPPYWTRCKHSDHGVEVILAQLPGLESLICFWSWPLVRSFWEDSLELLNGYYKKAFWWRSFELLMFCASEKSSNSHDFHEKHQTSKIFLKNHGMCMAFHETSSSSHLTKPISWVGFPH